MKVRTTTLVLVAALATPFAAQAMTGDLVRDVQGAASNGSVNVNLRDGVATLTGTVDSGLTANAVRRAALSNDSVERVIDLLDHD